MNNSENNFWNRKFSHIYIEKDILSHPRTNNIISSLKADSLTVISHYKDVFCKKNQSFAAQKNSPQIILAKKWDQFVYRGSNMCDNFGYENFYYTSDIMNCIYQCEYCYLQGMYDSANLVIFVNLEDTIQEVEKILSNTPLYLCISYDTDLLALENITGFVEDWHNFAALNPNIVIELRTKSANFKAISSLKVISNFILAWSVSPDEITKNYEINTPNLSQRLTSMKRAMQEGWKVRLCIDPMIHVENWEKIYTEMCNEIKNTIQIENLDSISIGVFRVPKDSLKKMRNVYPKSNMLAYPYSLIQGGYTYDNQQKAKMIAFVNELMNM